MILYSDENNFFIFVKTNQVYDDTKKLLSCHTEIDSTTEIPFCQFCIRAFRSQTRDQNRSGLTGEFFHLKILRLQLECPKRNLQLN